MTFETYELSEQAGAPVEIYEFFHGTTVYRYTSAEADVSVDGETYTSEPIRRTSIALSVEQPRNAIKLDVRRNLPVAELFRIAPPLEPIGLIVKRYHRGDTDVGTSWVGRVLNCGWNDTTVAQLICEPASISVNRMGLGRYYQVPCPYALFNPNDCKVDKASFAHATTIDAISGRELTVDSLGAHPYPGGWVEWASGGVYERRLIVSRSALVLTLARAFSSSVAVSDAVTVYPGCDHTIQTCNDVFANKLNYGGFIGMPKKNPFDGPPVY
jgi:uncharacterized phage protein (TIGR02218 family)